MEPKGSKKEPKGTKMEPKATKMEPKGCQLGPKWIQKVSKGPKWSPNGAKGEPKGDQNAYKNRYSEKVAKIEPGRILLASVFGPISIKNVIKNRYENRW